MNYECECTAHTKLAVFNLHSVWFQYNCVMFPEWTHCILKICLDLLFSAAVPEWAACKFKDSAGLFPEMVNLDLWNFCEICTCWLDAWGRVQVFSGLQTRKLFKTKPWSFPEYSFAAETEMILFYSKSWKKQVNIILWFYTRQKLQLLDLWSIYPPQSLWLCRLCQYL